jgi:uncharacterized protein (TIGR00369 family)
MSNSNGGNGAAPARGLMGNVHRGLSFVRAGLVGPTLKRMARVRTTWPARPALGAPIELPWGKLEEHRCFACSPRNPRGLQLAFHEAAGWDMACTYRPDDLVTNYPGMLHGGVAVTILDELLGQAVFHRTRHLPVSVEANVRWHKPVKVGEEVLAAARITATFDRVHAAKAYLFRADGKVAAELTGQYYTPSLEQFRKMAELESVLAVAQSWFAPGRAPRRRPA